MNRLKEHFATLGGGFLFGFMYLYSILTLIMALVPFTHKMPLLLSGFIAFLYVNVVIYFPFWQYVHALIMIAATVKSYGAGPNPYFYIMLVLTIVYVVFLFLPFIISGIALLRDTSTNDRSSSSVKEEAPDLSIYSSPDDYYFDDDTYVDPVATAVPVRQKKVQRAHPRSANVPVVLGVIVLALGVVVGIQTWQIYTLNNRLNQTIEAYNYTIKEHRTELDALNKDADYAKRNLESIRSHADRLDDLISEQDTEIWENSRDIYNIQSYLWNW